MTGQPDTNAISVQALNPNANADGSYNSIGLPVWVLPPYVWTNMYQGTWLASNSFICQAYNGPGVIGSSQGIIFAVDNTTNSYSFLRYPVSGYNVMNWFIGRIRVHPGFIIQWNCYRPDFCARLPVAGDQRLPVWHFGTGVGVH
jgi:hypothetical protein